MDARAAALLLLAVVCAGFAAGEVAVDCCFEKSDKFVPRKNLVGYSLLEAGKGCDISATVFITKSGLHLCIIHPSETTDKTRWVKNHIEYLKNKAARQQ